MNHIPVSSSNIESVAYCAQTRTLEVRFLRGKSGSGALYEYVDVEPHVFDSLMAAPSKGAYFAAHIKYKYAGRPVV